jgi:hypothetical protein
MLPNYGFIVTGPSSIIEKGKFWMTTAHGCHGLTNTHHRVFLHLPYLKTPWDFPNGPINNLDSEAEKSENIP